VNLYGVVLMRRTLAFSCWLPCGHHPCHVSYGLRRFRRRLSFFVNCDFSFFILFWNVINQTFLESEGFGWPDMVILDDSSSAYVSTWWFVLLLLHLVSSLTDW